MSPEDPPNVIARLRRRLENFQLIIESQDHREMKVLTRSEEEAALIDSFQRQAALDRDALNTCREELRVFPSDVAGFCAVLHNRKVTMEVALNDLLVFVERYASIPEATPSALKAIAMRLAHLKLANSGKVMNMSTMPNGGDINEINAWVERTREEEKGRVEREARNKNEAGMPVSAPDVLYYCPTCKRHVAQEDIKVPYSQLASHTDAGFYHADCGTTLERR